MNRIDQLFKDLQERKRKAFVSYLVAGDPHLDKTPELVDTLEKSGSDLIELGVPFSDPLADGIVNQLGSQRALDSGTTLEGIFQAVQTIRQKSEIPIVLFTYYNPIYHYGLQKFIAKAEKAGVDGALILDFPPEEAKSEWPESTSLKRISLIAPTTPPNRIAKITSSSSGFIYYVSREGVTGMQDSLPKNITEQIQEIRKTTKLPICVGFGISTPEQAQVVAQAAEGVVVGSAIVNKIAKNLTNQNLLQEVENFVTPLTQATHQNC
ncbi:MAG: tryptophan synthase subunit alpha [Verrucomicrobiota bacterium]